MCRAACDQRNCMLSAAGSGCGRTSSSFAEFTPEAVEMDGHTFLLMCDAETAGVDGVIQVKQLATLQRRTDGQSWFCTSCSSPSTCAHMTRARPVLNLPDLKVLRHGRSTTP